MNFTVLAHVEWWHWPLAAVALGLIVAGYVIELRLLREDRTEIQPPE